MIAISELLVCADRWRANAQVKDQTPGIPNRLWEHVIATGRRHACRACGSRPRAP